MSLEEPPLFVVSLQSYSQKQWEWMFSIRVQNTIFHTYILVVSYFAHHTVELSREFNSCGVIYVRKPASLVKAFHEHYGIRMAATLFWPRVCSLGNSRYDIRHHLSLVNLPLWLAMYHQLRVKRGGSSRHNIEYSSGRAERSQRRSSYRLYPR